MNTLTLVVSAVATVFAVGDWISRATDNRRLEYVCKPATLASLVIAALVVDPNSGPMRAWVVGALVLSLAGDVFLMLPTDRFVEGLGAFLFAHVAYVAGFVASGELRIPRMLLGALAVVVIMAVPCVRIVQAAVASDKALRVPISLYMAVISTMIVCAVGSGNLVAIIGAASFALSDSLIGWTRFVAPLRHSSVTIMVTYHIGQALLLLSII